ncbi:solute carrier family 25 member 44 isoform X1 [Nematostella vectensis]|uniref:solute carrier family 25 member 44 isoform X1 n=1 Tax=Nematostella vectensis TaxID=45351 RepID=UPI002077255B|nr:solute carrier family 25 member 44 isoform X1 [Nematostella vectensis]
MPEHVRVIEWSHLDKYKFYALSTAFYGGLGVALFPFDLVKTRLQVQKVDIRYNGTIDALRKIIRLEGFRGLYKGFAVSQLFLLTGNINSTSYEVTREQLSGFSVAIRGFIAGGLASLIEQSLGNPVEVMAQRLMVEGTGKRRAKGVYRPVAFRVVRNVYKEHGISGFYRGFLVSVINSSFWSGIWWASYGLYLEMFGQYAPSGSPHVVIQGLSGALSGVTAAVLCNPLEIMRVRLQVEGGKSLTQAFKSLLRNEGALALTKGMLPSVISEVPTSMVMIVGYETLKKFSLKEIEFDS